MTDTDLRAVARRALTLIDLTDLSDTCTADAIERLCARTVTAHGKVAAVCVFPRFVKQAKQLLAGSGVKVATVVNFPAGGEDSPAVLRQASAAVADGADEIDHVLAYRAFQAGRADLAEAQILALKRELPETVCLKVILETGVLGDPALIRQASELALAAGADFLKTSTGKVQVNATLPALRVMGEAILRCGRDAGLKPAGGIGTTAVAAEYLALVDDLFGPDWARPETFRFGASALLDALIATIEGGAAAKASDY